MAIPFQFGHLADGQNFINRHDEIKRLTTNFESGVNTMIISPRRWGKSSLVGRVVQGLASTKPHLRVVTIDMFSVRSEQQFLSLFAREVVKATSSKWGEWGDTVRTFIKNAIPKIAFGNQPGAEMELELNWTDKKINPLDIYDLPEIMAKKKKLKIVICIDEFQNIAHFADPVGVQGQMRSVWQKHQHASYCLYGSKKHFLTHIFAHQSMPFFRFGDLMYLPKIELSHWLKFIPAQFKKFDKKISVELTRELCQCVSLHPFYVQQLAQKVWILTEKEATKDVLDLGVEALLNDNAFGFQRDVENLPATQLNFLRAFKDGVTSFTTLDTLTKYELGTQGNIKRIKAALEQKDIMDFFGKRPELVDPLFELWFKRNFA
jgi:uncharacterized protein